MVYTVHSGAVSHLLKFVSRFLLTEIGLHLQPPDTFPGLYIQQKCVFGVFRAQETCLMAANIALSPLGEVTALPKSLSWIYEPTSQWGKESGEGKEAS